MSVQSISYIRQFFLCLVLSIQIVPTATAKNTLVFSTHIESGSIAYKSTYLLLNEAFSRIGYDFLLTTLPGKRSLIEANKGAFDGEAHRIGNINERSEFPNLIKVPEIQQVVANGIFSKRDLKINKKWQSLAGYSVVVPRGSIWLTLMAKKYATEVHELSNLNQILSFIQYDRADIALVSLEAVNLLRSQEYKESSIKLIGSALPSLPIYTYIHKKHKKIVPKLAYAFHQMKLDGSYLRLMRQSRTNDISDEIHH